MKQMPTRRTKGRPSVHAAAARNPRRTPSPSFASFPSVIFLFLIVFATVSLPAAEIPASDTTPRRGGTLRLWFPRDFRSLDPAIGFTDDSVPLQLLLFRGLLDFDGEGRLVLSQASAWNVSPDGRTYTFRLKPGVRFAHGREVEAEDYVFSMERILDPRTGSLGQSYFSDILGAGEFTAGKAAHVAGLRAPDPHTLIIELARPAFTFRYVLTMLFATVLPREVVRTLGADFPYQMVGSGPYRLTEWRRDVRWRFERNPYYSGTDGWVDAVEIMIGGDTMVGVMMLERGEIDRVRVDAVSALRFARDPRLRSWLHTVSPVMTGYLFLNTEMTPFDDVRVRRAVSYAINKQRLVLLTGGLAVVAHGVVPPTMPWTNPSLPDHEFSPEKARALLREAGLASGFKTTLWFDRTHPINKRMAEGIQQDLTTVGIELELKGVSQPAFEVTVGSRRQAPCGVANWTQDYPDPSNFLDILFRGAWITDGSCNNRAFYNNPEVDQRLITAADSLDPDERRHLYREAETLVMRDAPWVPLYHEQHPILCHPRLRGDVPDPIWLWRYENMWLAE